jgi:signal transduction histidine kinase
MSELAQEPAPVRVLLLEDNVGDAALVTAVLRGAGRRYDVHLVSDQEAFEQRVRTSADCDVIVSDYQLRGYNGLEALRLLRAIGSRIPLVLVTGTLDDDIAAQCITLGVADYVLKDRLARLPEAIQRALEQQRLRDEHARLEEELRQAQKMEAVGQLAGGIAHDFNNLLMVIRGFAELLHARVGGDNERRQVQHILAAAERASHLVSQLLAFSRKQVLAPRVIDLNECVVEAGKLLRRVLGEHIELSVVTDPALTPVRADPVQIEQVLMNLGINARDAMPQGGRLIVETCNEEIDASHAARHPDTPPANYVRLTVSDTGAGMDHETRQRIFEPFFTTKRDSGGTGLGLATVYGIVKQSGGFITVYSEPGEGTTFKVYFPAVTGKVEHLEAAADSGLVANGNENVLVVEDEVGVREAIAEFLRGAGYSVVVAGSGPEALERVEAEDPPIDLLVTDVVMPRMSGRELAQRLVAGRPALRVLYISGFTGRVISGDMQLEPSEAFLEKPFAWNVFARKVREVLEAPAAPAPLPADAKSASLD